MENYYKDQLGKIVLDKTYAPQIKITSLNTETKWLELNEESASEIRNWLDKNYPAKENTMEYYIEYLSAKNNFRLTRQEFETEEDAIIWGKENLPNFHLDMIKIQ